MSYQGPPQEPQQSYEPTQWAGMQYNMTPPPSIGYGNYQCNSYEKISEYRPGILLRIVKGIFYFLATLITAFGCFGEFESYGKAGLGLFFFFGVIIAGVVLFVVYLRHRITKLRWGRYILWIIGATVGWFMAALLEYAIFTNFTDPKAPIASFILGSIFILYGLVLATTAIW